MVSSVRRAQRGAALIVALLVLTLVALLAVTVSDNFFVLFRKVENQLHSQQAYRYLLGVEGLARQVLLTDLESDAQQGTFMDYALENGEEQGAWLDNPIVFPMEFGAVSGELNDLQGRFNLNTLVTAAGDGIFSVDQQRFIRLLQSLDVDPPIDVVRAQELTNAIGDWLDNENPPQDRLPGGGEDYIYVGMEPSRRPANRLMLSASELQWVAGFTPEIVQQLAPLITCWPLTNAALNINTMGARLLATLNVDKNLTLADQASIESLAAARIATEGFASINDVKAVAGLTPDTDLTGVDVKSDYFLLTAQAEFLGRRYQLRSVLWRDSNDNSVRVITRSLGSL